MDIVSFEIVSFSVASHAAWAPRVENEDEWLAWAQGRREISGSEPPPVAAMSPMLRRRAGFLGKMALEVAYRCLGDAVNVPSIFSSRHGEASRSVDLLLNLAKGEPLSPASFSLSVHNASCGLFSIARDDHAASGALAAGRSTVEHAVIEACGLLAEGERAVLLVVYDCPLPGLYSSFADCREQPYAWAWLMQPPADEVLSLAWSAAREDGAAQTETLPHGLEVLRFYLRKDRLLRRLDDKRQWLWSRHG